VKGRLTAYAGYQLRDYFVNRAGLILLATALAALGFGAARGWTLSDLDLGGSIEGRERVQQAFELALVIFAFAAGAVAAIGLVSRHRSRGYDRLFFSRPISPLRYYMQGFVLGGIGGVVLAIIGAELSSIAVHPVSLLGVVGYVALAWLLIGGLAFLLSTLTAFHLPILALVIGADLALGGYAGPLTSAAAGSVAEVVQYVLPPAHVLVSLREPLARGLPVDPRALAWPAGFGVVCLVIAMILLQRRPFRA
jgi:ABC-type transport system involved in multi-copper enzyme maturation permease subunit